MMEIRAYQDGDLAGIKGKREDLTGVVGGWSFTVHKDGEPLVCFGCDKFWDGVGHIWMVAGSEIRGHGLELLRLSRDMLNKTMDQFGYNRIQAYVSPESEENARWVKLLGMRLECTLEKMSPDGSDIDVYKITR
tara:strand:- start:8571 stop:8972 length:402 start_codon:yes stop_codon:yes gene_type:complete